MRLLEGAILTFPYEVGVQQPFTVHPLYQRRYLVHSIFGSGGVSPRKLGDVSGSMFGADMTICSCDTPFNHCRHRLNPIGVYLPVHVGTDPMTDSGVVGESLVRLVFVCKHLGVFKGVGLYKSLEGRLVG